VLAADHRPRKSRWKRTAAGQIDQVDGLRSSPDANGLNGNHPPRTVLRSLNNRAGKERCKHRCLHWCRRQCDGKRRGIDRCRAAFGGAQVPGVPASVIQRAGLQCTAKRTSGRRVRRAFSRLFIRPSPPGTATASMSQLVNFLGPEIIQLDSSKYRVLSDGWGRIEPNVASFRAESAPLVADLLFAASRLPITGFRITRARLAH
jgi:hypothetical protein